MIEEKRTSKGSGRKCSDIIIRLRKVNLIKLMNKYTQIEIAQMYGISTHLISKELTVQLSKRDIGLKATDANVDKRFSIGMWMDSKERIAIVQYKLVSISCKEPYTRFGDKPPKTV